MNLFLWFLTLVIELIMRQQHVVTLSHLLSFSNSLKPPAHSWPSADHKSTRGTTVLVSDDPCGSPDMES